MTEQEKDRVIHGLNSCGFHDGIPNVCDVTECPYRNDPTYCTHHLAHDAGILMRELLKAQEPKTVVNIHKQYNNVLNPNAPWVGKCPKCGKKIDGRNLTRFCKYCGQAVKWE